MKSIRQTFPTTVQDRFLAAMDGPFIPVVLLEMEFDRPLDEHRLATAVVRTMEAVPVLGCRYVSRPLRPYWERSDLDPGAAFTLTRDRHRYESFKNAGIDFHSGPQLASCLYRSGPTDSLVLKISHLVSDAAGLRHVAGVVSDTYNRLADHPEHRPDPDPCRLRGCWTVLRHVPRHAYPGIVANYLREVTAGLVPRRTRAVPIRDGKATADRYITRHVERAAVTRMVDYGKERGATVNDLLLAASFRALSRIGKGDDRAALRLGMTIDLRRYGPPATTESVANLSFMELITYGAPIDEDFGSTLDRVVQTMKKRKSSWLGVNTVGSIYAALWALPFVVLDRLIKRTLALQAASSNSFDWFTNLGRISRDHVRFGEAPVRAWLLPPGCNLPMLLYGLSGYDGSVTLSASIMPDDDGMNEAVTGRFIDLVISELPTTR